MTYLQLTIVSLEMPKIKRSTIFQHSIFGNIGPNLSSIFEYDSEVYREKTQRNKYILQHTTELYSDILLISLTEEIELYKTILEIYNIWQEIKKEKAKDNAIWQETLSIMSSPDFTERSPSPDCDSDFVFKKMRFA